MRLFGVFLLFVTSSVAFGAGPCAGTPEAAVRAFEEGAASDGSVGFRVVTVRMDAALGRQWAEVKRCEHPEWPGVHVAARVAARVDGERGVAVAEVAVRAGETVKVWRHEEHARLEMAAVSDEVGAVGDRIRLHVATANGAPVRYCYGLVRGPGNVEMER